MFLAGCKKESGNKHLKNAKHNIEFTKQLSAQRFFMSCKYSHQTAGTFHKRCRSTIFRIKRFDLASTSDMLEKAKICFENYFFRKIIAG